MEVRIGKKKYKVKAMDIETHNDIESIAKKETSMWLGCYIDEDSKVNDEKSYFYSMNEFIDILDKETQPYKNEKRTNKRNNIVIYIYNLSFEWSFLLPVLLERGFKWSDIVDKDSEYCYNSVSTKSCSSVWQVSIKCAKKNGLILLRDLSKIYGGGLDEVAKAFKLETQKGEIDYRLNRLHNYKITEEEKIYCFKDTRIIIEILLKMLELDDKDFWNSISMASYSMKKLVKRGYPRDTKPYSKFRKGYPELSQKETDFLREGVEGGITYAPEGYQFKLITDKICHIDAHQMHPSSAYLHLFPYGEGMYFEGEPPISYISACRIRISYDYVKLHSIIKLIGLPFIEDKELVVWNFEIPTMKKCYVNLRIEYIDGYAYKCKPLPWRQYYADNYNKRLIAKKNKDAFYTLYYKLLNNSSYGKLLEKPHNISFANYINDFGIIDSLQIPKEDIKVNAKYTYLPVGSCIPAYSRVALIELALEIGWEYIVYFDTDSIFFLWNEKTEAVWNKTNQEDFLGGWGLEEMIDRAQFTAPKRYKTETDGVATIKSGGINFDNYKATHYPEALAEGLAKGLKTKDALKEIQLDFEEVNIVSSTWKVQRAYRVKGGTLIEFEDKEMSVQKKYKDIYKKNVEESS